MDDESTKDLATRAFQKRVLDEFAAVREEQAEMQKKIAEIHIDVRELQAQQAAMAKNIAVLDQRVTSIDERLTKLEDQVDRRLQETRPIWESVQDQLQKLVEKFDYLILDFHDLRQQMRIHGRRISKLERAGATTKIG